MTARPVLIGVGVGPGDPDLVTVKGVKALQSADIVFVPVAAQGEAAQRGQPYQGYAERVVRAHVTAKRIVPLTFALGDSATRREADWDAAGAEVAAALQQGDTEADVDGAGGAVGVTAAFATIGDPNLYSTFTYLAATVRRHLPDLEVRTIPGITALQDLAARSGTVLAEGAERLALLPFTAGQDQLAAALDDYDTVVAYKGGRALARIRSALQAAGRLDDAVLGARLGLDDEVVGPLAAHPPAAAAPYLSTVIVTRPRGGRGARLR